MSDNPIDPTPISSDFTELSLSEAVDFWKQHHDAWQDPSIPRTQYDIVVRHELSAFARQLPVVPYDIAVSVIRQITKHYSGLGPRIRLLDVGASCGYYCKVFQMRGLDLEYVACDSNPLYFTLHDELILDGVLPLHPFTIEDIRTLSRSIPPASYDVVFSGGTIQHVLHFVTALHQLMRASRQWVVLHRTPIHRGPSHRYYSKKAYGIDCLEIHFSLPALLALFDSLGLRLEYIAEISWDEEHQYGYSTYLLRRT